jgi:predicted RNA binding protein YcfA (HicA-like mRNA interferase family)
LKRGITARQVIRALEDDGFALVRTDGSHQRYAHPDGRKVTVSRKGSQTFPLKTLRSIVFAQARWDEADLRRHGFA